jgi:xanthine dehydrogenase accessory factor
MKIFDDIARLSGRGMACMLVTAIDKTGAGPVEAGKKMIVCEDGQASGTVGGGALEFHAREKCKELMKTRHNLLKKYYLNEGEIIEGARTLPMVCGGTVTLFYEYIGPDAYVYVFGAGHVGQATVNVLKTMNYHVTVIDERTPVIDVFKGADKKVNSSFVDFIRNEGIREGGFVLICTPSHKYDYNVIEEIIELGMKPAYIGMLCSLEKLADFMKRIKERFGDVDLANFYSPVGLDTGGGSPEEIAVSICAEILAVKNGKSGHRHMRPGENK